MTSVSASQATLVLRRWDMPMLHGSGVYEANEGIRIDQIKAALRRDLPS